MQRKEQVQDQKTQENDINPVLLSRTELHWLLGKTKVSKIFEYQIRGRIKKKVKTLMELELPLLVKCNFIDNGLGRDLETGPIMTTPALVRQRSRDANSHKES
jgi:hypothetical protein